MIATHLLSPPELYKIGSKCLFEGVAEQHGRAIFCASMQQGAVSGMADLPESRVALLNWRHSESHARAGNSTRPLLSGPSRAHSSSLGKVSRLNSFDHSKDGEFVAYVDAMGSSTGQAVC